MPESGLGIGPRLIAVGGGKGGAGRTLVATGLAVFVAQLGKRVVLVDAAAQAATQSATFGIARADGVAPPWAPAPVDLRGVETVIPNLRLLEAASERGPRSGVPVGRPRELARVSGADYLVVDLAAGTGGRTLTAMLDADAMVVVVTPEPASVEALYRFVRHAYARRLAAKLRELPSALLALRGAVRAAVGPPMPVQLAEAVAGVSSEVAAVAWGELGRLRVRVVVNQSRSRADLDLGEALARVCLRRMGVPLDYIGHVEFDDAVFLAARRRRPLLVDAPAAKASRNLERIARRLLAAETGRAGMDLPRASGAAVPPPPPTHYDLMALDRGASDEEIRRAYRKTREIYAGESLALAGLLTEQEVSAMVARIEEARDVLLDPSRRRPYDLSITPASELPLVGTLESLPEIDDTPMAVVTPPVTPDTEFSGALLKAVRESRGAELKDVAARTKISLQYLRAMEDEDFGALPQMVYTRGFVTEVAKYLRLDVEQVVRTYLRRLRKATEKG